MLTLGAEANCLREVGEISGAPFPLDIDNCLPCNDFTAKWHGRNAGAIARSEELRAKVCMDALKSILMRSLLS